MPQKSNTRTRSFRYARNPRWAIIRAQILAREDYLCLYCGDWAQAVDHILPHSYGGTDDADNLASACRFCNGKAGDKVFDSFDEKKEYLQQFFAEKVKRMRRRICICPDCGELFEWRKNNATAVLCGVCNTRDLGYGVYRHAVSEMEASYSV